LKCFSEIPRLKLTAGEGFCEDLSCHKARVRDGGELECALVDVTGTGKTVPSCREKQLETEKTFQKTFKFSDCRESIRKQIRPSCRRIFRVRFVFVWFRESSEIQRFERIFGLHSKCLCKELPPLSNFTHKAKKKFAEGGKA